MEYVSKLIFEGENIQIGEWRCYPDSALWREENIAGRKPMIVFPRSAVQIQQAGRDMIVTSPNHVVYYNKDQTYRRGLASQRGDICEYVYIEPEVLAEIHSTLGMHHCDDIHTPFVNSGGPLHTKAFSIQRTICNLIKTQNAEPLFVEETFMSILPKLLIDSDRLMNRKKPARANTLQKRRLQVESVKEHLNYHFSNEVSLDDVAKAGESSAFHISRVFKQQTGSSIFQYLISLRLRIAFEQMIDSKRSLTRIAMETGFSSQSHMTNLFKREFGLTPSSLRRNKPKEIIQRIVNWTG